MKKRYDHVVIGSGMGGLAAAITLAKEGHSVCVLEKNNQFGGNLQTFVRDRTIFDTGVHYLGGLTPGHNLHQYFKHLGIMDHLEVRQLSVDGFDVFSFDGDDRHYRHAQGLEHFAAELKVQFPKEGKAIDTYCAKLQEYCSKFPMYDLKPGAPYAEEPGLLTLGAREYIDSITEDKVLRAVLGGSNLLYAGDHDRSPFYVHALSVYSYIQSAYRVVRGGSQITKLLVRELRKHGGEIFKHHEVERFEFEGERIMGARCRNGVLIEGDNFISNLDPKRTIAMAGAEHFRKPYVRRVNSIEPTIGAFCLYIALKPGSFPYMDHNIYHFRGLEDVWRGQDYSEHDWPRGYMISSGEKAVKDEWAENMTVMTYMKFDAMAPWTGSTNTVIDVNDRGQSYEEFKADHTERLLNEVYKRLPELRGCIAETYSSTPLSYRDYIHCDGGGMYGYVKDVNTPLRSFISSRTKVPNLFITGQCTNMHGILGVTISAVLTCTEVLEDDSILEKIFQVPGAPQTA